MKIGFYSYTVGPATMLKIIATEASQKGHTTIQLEENKPGVVSARKGEMGDCDIVAIGGDSARIEESIELLEYLLAKNIPVVVVEDTPGTALRPALAPYARRIAKALTCLQQDLSATVEFGYTNVSNVIPPHWGVSYSDMMDKPSVRQSFSKRLSNIVEPLNPKDKIIYVPGTKVPEVNNLAILGAIAAGKPVLKDNFVFHFRRHLGEVPNEKISGDVERFNELFAKRREMMSGLSVLEPGSANNPQLVRAADVTIFPGGGPTESIVAAYARLATCYYWNDLVSSELKKIGISSGKWFVAELGGSVKVTNPDQLAQSIEQLLSAWGRDKLNVSQIESFPLPETWDTAPRIVEIFESVAKTSQI